MKLLPSSLALTAALLAPGAMASDFEGIVHMKMTDNNKSQEIDYQVKEGYVRTDINVSGGHSASVIMDFQKQQMIILIPQQRMYMIQPMPQAPAIPATMPAQGAAPSASMVHAPENTGETKTILGYTCTKYEETQANGSTVDMWATTELGNFAGLGGGGMGRRGQPPPDWVKGIAGRGFFPLLVEGKNAQGKKFSLEVTAIDKESLADSVFGPPLGYKEFNMGGMMGGMFGGHP